VRHTPVYMRQLSLPKHDVTEGFMALGKTRSDYLALVCMGVARNLRCHKDSMLTARNWYSDKPVLTTEQTHQ